MYARDGTVDSHNNPAHKNKTGKWKACRFILGMVLILYIYRYRYIISLTLTLCIKFSFTSGLFVIVFVFVHLGVFPDDHV